LISANKFSILFNVIYLLFYYFLLHFVSEKKLCMQIFSWKKITIECVILVVSLSYRINKSFTFKIIYKCSLFRLFFTYKCIYKLICQFLIHEWVGKSEYSLGIQVDLHFPDPRLGRQVTDHHNITKILLVF
jgi:hypothetical protein